MAGDDKPEEDDDKTVFLPPERTSENSAKGEASSKTEDEYDDDDDDEKTVFVPRQAPSEAEAIESEEVEGNVPGFADLSDSAPSPAPGPTPAPPSPAPSVSNSGIEASSPPPDPSAFPAGQDLGATPIQPVAIGDYVNVFRIERFIAKGGMGEVYEAVNPHPPFESVAVKLMLSDLANDKNALEMFYKEASALGRVHHQAIVQYRIASQSPNGQPYLITEFVPGPSLQELLGKLELDETQLQDLTKRLSRGLGAAHKEDVVHRDIAPDNVLLAEGNPERPKIIDFGIVKDTHENGKTIIGDGFAGKLRYVAPEQLGEYDFNVGPWTDIYSLALTMLAVASGKHADMGSSLSDAVRKRLGVPDLSAFPDSLRPAFEAALQPNPADRPQSMEAFAKLLDEGAAAPSSQVPADTNGEASFAPMPGSPSGEGKDDDPDTTTSTGSLGATGETKKKLIYGGVGAIVLLAALVGILIVATSPDEIEDADIAVGEAAPTAQEAARPPIEQVAQQAAAQVPCAWLTFEGSEGNTARFSGGAARQGTVLRDLQAAFAGSGYSSVSLDMSAVIDFGEDSCPMIDALKSVRSDPPILSTPQNSYVLKMQDSKARGGDAIVAKPTLNASGLTPGHDAILLHIDENGAEMWLPTRENIERLAGILNGQVTQTGFSVTFEYETPGQHGLILLTGNSQANSGGGKTLEDLIPREGEFATLNITQNWARQFEQQAKAAGWKADIVWFSIKPEQ